MKATYKGWCVEGTTDEIRELINGTRTTAEAPVPMIPIVRKKRHRHFTSNAAKDWKKEDDTYLLQQYGRISVKEIAKYLGRTAKAVRVRKSLLAAGKKFPSKRGGHHQRWTSEDDMLLRKECELLGKNPTFKQVMRMQRRVAKQLRRTTGAIQVRRTLLGLTFFDRTRKEEVSAEQSAATPSQQERDRSVLKFKETSVDDILVESVLKHMIKMGSKLNWQNAGYVLGIQSHWAFRDWVSAVIARSAKISDYFGVANKFKTNGLELWYG